MKQHRREGVEPRPCPATATSRHVEPERIITMNIIIAGERRPPPVVERHALHHEGHLVILLVAITSQSIQGRGGRQPVHLPPLASPPSAAPSADHPPGSEPVHEHRARTGRHVDTLGLDVGRSGIRDDGIGGDHEQPVPIRHRGPQPGAARALGFAVRMEGRGRHQRTGGGGLAGPVDPRGALGDDAEGGAPSLHPNFQIGRVAPEHPATVRCQGAQRGPPTCTVEGREGHGHETRRCRVSHPGEAGLPGGGGACLRRTGRSRATDTGGLLSAVAVMRPIPHLAACRRIAAADDDIFGTGAGDVLPGGGGGGGGGGTVCVG